MTLPPFLGISRIEEPCHHKSKESVLLNVLAEVFGDDGYVSAVNFAAVEQITVQVVDERRRAADK
jgi:hypothetical protein